MKTIMTLTLLSLLAVACDKQEKITQQRSNALEERQEAITDARQKEQAAVERARAERQETVRDARARYDKENNELQREEAVEMIQDGKNVDIQRDGERTKIRVDE